MFFIDRNLKEKEIEKINEKGDIYIPNINKNGRQIGLFKLNHTEFETVDGVLYHALGINQNFNHSKMVKNNKIIDSKTIDTYYKVGEKIDSHPIKVEFEYKQPKSQLLLEQEFKKQKDEEEKRERRKQEEKNNKDLFRYVISEYSKYTCKYCSSGAYKILDKETGKSVWISECSVNHCKDGADTNEERREEIEINNKWIELYNSQFVFPENHLPYQYDQYDYDN